MLGLRDPMPVDFLKKGRLTESHNGIRFRVEKLGPGGEDGPRLGVTIQPEPYGYDAILEKEEEQQTLSLDADGIAGGVDWLNEQFEGQRAGWKAVSRG